MNLFQVTKKQEIEGYELRTMTGDIVSFTPSYSEPLPEPFSNLHVKCEINATGGNGTPDNPNPINGYTEANITRCGVNLWDEEWEQGAYDENGEKTGWVNAIRSKGYIGVTPSSTIYVHFGTSARFFYYWYASDKQFISRSTINSSGVITVPNNAYFITFGTNNDYGTTYNNDISINYPATDTTYHPYTGNAYTIAFGQTVYGGVLDVTRGKLKVTHILKKVSDISWTYRTISGVTGYIFLSNDITGAKEGQSPTMSSCYEIKTNRNYIDGDGQVAISNNTTALDIVVKDDSYTTADDFVQNRGNETFVFELATPFDIDLTPRQIEALLGVNNVWHDGNGDIEVTCLI